MINSFAIPYLFTSIYLFFPFATIIFSGETPLNPVAYTGCVLVFILGVGYLFWGLSALTKYEIKMFQFLDTTVFNIVVLILLFLILIFPYIFPLDFF